MRILHIIGAAFILIAAPALAKDGAAARWTVTQTSGDVRVIRSGMQPASLQAKSLLSPGDVIATGASGRAVITRADDYVVVAPGSKLILPKEEKSGFTRLLQEVGTMLYKVRHTGVPHFTVETPLLAAVVKGTSFTVVVDDKRTAVQVTEGLVEVSSADGATRRLVERGVTVYIGSERPGQINVVGPETFSSPDADQTSIKVEKGEDVSLTVISDLTGGLVRAAPVAPTIEADTKPVAGTLTVSAVATDTKSTSPVVSEVVVTDVITPVLDVVGGSTPVVTTSPIPATTPVVATPITAVTPVVAAPVAAITPVVAAPVAVVAPIVAAPIAVVAPIVAPVVAPLAPLVPIAPIPLPVVVPILGIGS